MIPDCIKYVNNQVNNTNFSNLKNNKNFDHIFCVAHYEISFQKSISFPRVGKRQSVKCNTKVVA